MTRFTCSKPGCDRPPQRKPDGAAMKFCQRHNDENRERNRRFRAERGGKPKPVTAAGGYGTEARMSELTKSEAARLAEIELQIENAAAGIIGGLKEIRDERLYRATHDTFEDYCQSRWKMTRSYANRLIRAEEVVADLVPIGTKREDAVIPETEAVAREVSKAPPEKRAETWRKAVDTAPKDEAGEPVVTARHVSKLVAEFAKEGADPVGETAKPDGPAWAAFESEVEELVGELTAIERKMMRVLDSHAAENKCRAPWAYFIPYSGTVGLVRQARKALLDNLPAEVASKHPGYISRKAVEQREAVERQGRKSA